MIHPKALKGYHMRMNNAFRRPLQSSVRWPAGWMGRWTLLLLLLALTSGCLGSHNRPLQLIRGAGPVYPPVAKSQGIEGEVTVRYGVTRAGLVIDAEVVTATPAGVFEEAALAAVRSWRYTAPVRNGQAQAVPEVTSVVRFRLHESPEYLLDD